MTETTRRQLAADHRAVIARARAIRQGTTHNRASHHAALLTLAAVLRQQLRRLPA